MGSPITDLIQSYNQMCEALDEENEDVSECGPPPFYVGEPNWEKLKETIVDFLHWAHMTYDVYHTIALLVESGIMSPIISGDIMREIMKEFNPTSNAEAAPIVQANSLFTTALSAGATITRKDPLILDLDGDGIETTNVKDGAYFDHDANGFAEQTGWAGADDGLLVMDRNGDGIINDGRELFGDQTILSTGQRASNGFQALSELDSNKDGKIDANDTAFNQLKVWQDVDGDGYSTADELKSLSDVGIQSINLNSTPSTTTDPEGNTQTRTGSFEKADGTTGNIAEYNLQRDTAYTIANEWLDVPPEIEVLPDIQGYGNVHDLHQSIVRDTSGQLKSLIEQFSAATDTATRNSLMEQILYKWTNSDTIDPNSRGTNIDARKLAILEKFFGQAFVSQNGANPTYEASILLKEAYRGLSEMMYSQLMAQTHMKDLYGAISYTWDDATQSVKADMSAVIADIQNSLASGNETGKTLLGEFSRTIRGFNAQDMMNYLSFREIFITLDPSFGWIIDSAGLPVVSNVYIHTWGTDNSEAIIKNPLAVDNIINGHAGNDVIYGTAMDDRIYKEGGAATVAAGAGNDTIWAAEGNDILDGGEGNDILMGGEGNDTYIFRKGSGQDTITDSDATAGNTDAIYLGSNLTPNDIAIKRIGNDLTLRINDTTDKLTVKDYFRNNSPLNRIEKIQFMDGTVWTDSDIIQGVLLPTEGDDTIYGGIGSDNLRGLGGNDSLYGQGGNDTLQGDIGDDKLFGGAGDDNLDGGEGNDALDGGTGSDAYIFGRGSGQDAISDVDTTADNTDAILLGADIAPSDIKLERMGNDIKLSIAGAGDTLTIKNWSLNDNLLNPIENIQFSDGTVWDAETIKNILLQGTEGNDTLYGYSSNDTSTGRAGNDIIYGRAGDDTINGDAGDDKLYGETGADILIGGDGRDYIDGGQGNDILDGGAGNDYLDGGAGNDTYIFGRGSGEDVVIDRDATLNNLNTILLSSDITPADITIQRSGENLVLSINGTNDTLTVKNWFWNDSAIYQVEQIRFADGTTWDADAIKQLVLQGTETSDLIIGYNTADSMQGFGGDDQLYARAGDDTLDGGAGNDYLVGEGGNDTLQGGAGNDNLYGGLSYYAYLPSISNGNDTYIFGRGSGSDIVWDYDTTTGNIDTILLASDITPNDVVLRHNDENLVLSINGTNDTLTVKNWFWNDSPEWRVERIQFADGTVWDVQTIKELVLQGTEGDDAIYGDSAPDAIHGLGGNDQIYGSSGDDILNGGTGDDALQGDAGNDTLTGSEGNDTLYGSSGDDILDGGTDDDTIDGGAGNDTYIFGRGSGQDIVIDYDNTPENIDTIAVAADVLPSDVKFAKVGDNLCLIIDNTSDRLQITDWFASDANKIERIQFADGTVWDNATIQAMTSTPTDSDDFLVGTSESDAIDGGGGNDQIFGQEGDDRLYGSSGYDYLLGEDGNDILDGGSEDDYLEGGSGDDTLIGGEGNDTLNGGYGINILNGGSGDDHIIYENVNEDTYIIMERGDGFDDVTIQSGGVRIESAIVEFGEGITPEDLSIQMNTGDVGDNIQLAIGIGNDEGMLIKSVSSGEGYGGGLNPHDFGIERLVFADGQELTIEQVLARADGGVIGSQYGTEGEDFLKGSVADDSISGYEGNDKIDARDNEDGISGGTGNDVISAGSGDDYVTGNEGNDILAGGRGDDDLWGDAGNDVYVFNRGDGNDDIYNYGPDPSTIDTLSFGTTIKPEDVFGYVGTDSYGEISLCIIIKDSADKITIWYWNPDDPIASQNNAIKRAQFIDEAGNARIFDLTGIVSLLKDPLLAATPDNPIPLFTVETSGYELMSLPITGGDYAVAYAQTGDLFAQPAYYTGTAGGDVINGRAGDDEIDAGNGDNIVDAGDGNNNVYAGDGNDWITTGSGNDAINGGEGDNVINAGAGNDEVIAGRGDDVVNAGAGDDIIAGGGGSDTLIGGSGNDTYVYNLGDGVVTINDLALQGEGNRIIFGEGITPDDLHPAADGNTLIINIGSGGDNIRLNNFNPDDAYGLHAVELYEFSDGQILSYSQLIDKGFDFTGTETDDLLNGTSAPDRITTLGGDDVITGGQGNDTLDGGSGSDTYVFNLGDGVDTIVDGTAEGAGNAIQFGQGINVSDIQLSAEQSALVINIGNNGDALRLEGFNPDDVYGQHAVEEFRFSDGTVMSYNDLIGLGFTFNGTSENDNLTGTNTNDTFKGGAGNDMLSGGEGDDTYYFNHGDGVDTINDETTPMQPNTLIFGSGIMPSDIRLSHNTDNKTMTINIGNTGEAVHLTNFDAADPYGSHAIEYFQFSDGTVLTYSQLIDIGFDIIGGSGDDNLSGTGTIDRITGNAGNDTLSGGAGNDRLIGGEGDDTYVFNKGDGVDLIDDTAITSTGNTLVFGEGITLADMRNSLTYRDNTLIIRIGESGDEVHLTGFDPNAADTGNRAVEQFQFADGTILTYEQLVQNTFIVQGDFGDDALTGTNLTDRLYGYEGSDNLSGGLGNDTLTGGTGNDELIGGAGNDTYVFNLGDGVDTIEDSATSEAGNQILFGEGITKDDLRAHLDGATLTIEYGAGGDAIRLENFDYNAINGSHVIDTIEFADGSQVRLTSLVDPGTEGDDVIIGTYFDDIINAKGGNDNVITSNGDDTVAGGSGNDVISTGDGDDMLTGGRGNDILEGGAGHDTYIYNIGDGIDTIKDTANSGEGNTIQFGAGITINDLRLRYEDNTLIVRVGLGAGDELRLEGFNKEDALGLHAVESFQFSDDSYITYKELIERLFLDPGTEGDDIINTGPSDDVINAKGGNDIVNTDGGNDTLTGGKGNDVLNGGAGDDTYVFNQGDGVDVIDDLASVSERNTLVFGEGITPNSLRLNYQQSGVSGQLQIEINENDKIQLMNFNPNDALGSHAIETFQFADGTTLTYSQLIDKGFDLTGTAVDDIINGTNVVDRVTALEGNDTINAGAGDDVIEAGSGDDIISAGSGNDAITGGVGNDALSGGAGDDTYIYNLGDGLDKINDSDGIDTITMGTGIDFDHTIIRIEQGVAHLRLLDAEGNETTEGIDIQLSADSSQPIEKITFADGTSKNMQDMVIEQRTTYGTKKSDLIRTGRHDDTIYALNGNDIVYAGLSNDTVYGGNGNDKLYGEQGNDILYGDKGNDLLDGGNGNDILYGGKGKDTLIGGKGNDTIYAGKGKDTILFDRGDGHDTIKSYQQSAFRCEDDGHEGHEDTVKLGVNPLDLIFSRSGSDLEVMINGGTDSITIEDWDWKDKDHRGRNRGKDDKEFLIDEFRTADGKHLDDRKVEQLIQAMASFSTDNGMSWSEAIQQKPQEAQAVLAQYWTPQT